MRYPPRRTFVHQPLDLLRSTRIIRIPVYEMRKLAERLSRGIVLRRRLPSRFQNLPIYVTPEAGLRYWLSMSRVDPALQGMVEELVHPALNRMGRWLHVGLFSFCAAALAERGLTVFLPQTTTPRITSRTL